MITRDRNIAHLEVAILTSAELVPPLHWDIIDICLGVKNVNHPWMLALQRYRLQYHVIWLNGRQLNERIITIVVSEDVWQWAFADLALELAPVNTGVV